MTLNDIREQVMFQTNNDAEDVGDFMPSLTDYINEGYDRLVNVWAKQHVSSMSADWPALYRDTDIPKTPEWTHRFLADWATWLVYRNGNPQKQQRGMAFRSAFEEMLAKVAGEGGASGLNEDGTQKQFNKFINIPR